MTPARRTLWGELAEPRSVISFLLLYCAVHFLVRYLLSPNFTAEESQQVLFAQSGQWAYQLHQPPLMSWLDWIVLTGAGGGRAAFFLLTYGIMAAGLVAYFAAARVAIRDVRLAALAAFALTSSWVAGYLAVNGLVAPVLTAALSAAFLWAASRVLTKGSPRDYLLLALTAGLGILSGYSFLLVPAGLAVAIALTPRLRARIKVAPLLLAIILAAALAAPYLWWAMHAEAGVFASQAPESATDWTAALRLIGFGLPLIAIFPLVYWPACKVLDSTEPDDGDWLRLYGIAFAAAIAILLLAAIITSPAVFTARWIYPAILPLPIYLFLRARIAQVSDRANRIFAGIALLFALGVIGSQFFFYYTGVKDCIDCSVYWPVQTIARDIQRGMFTSGTVVAETQELGGNLRAAFPDARVVAPGAPAQVYGPHVPGPCLVVWPGSRAPAKALSDYLAANYGVTISDGAVRGDADALLLTSKTRRITMNYVLIQKSTCSGT